MNGQLFKNILMPVKVKENAVVERSHNEFAAGGQVGRGNWNGRL